jgi:membrane associated rhomboid family serine protease
MLLPVSCDTPLYHLPIATVGLIVTNIVAFALLITGQVDPLNGWVLMYGQGMHPAQWLLSIFAHGGFGHLLGNMFFLWTFGMVVEGKIGWWRFLAAYLVIGLGESAIEQAIMLGSPSGPGSVGASAAIYGLMAMACIWAPMNEIKMVGFLGYYFFTFDVTVVVLAALYVGIEVAWALITSSIASALMIDSSAWSSVLHLMGAVLGGILGVVMVKRKLVDCDNWDIFAVLRGEQGEPTKEELAPPSVEQVAAHQQKKALEAKQKILAYLQIGQAPQALLILRKIRDLKLPLELSRQEQLKLIAGLDQHKQWADSAPLMAQFVEQFPDNCAPVRLRLAQICLVELQRPAKTLELLGPLQHAQLNENQNLLCKKLTAVAKHQIDEGAVELDEAI